VGPSTPAIATVASDHHQRPALALPISSLVPNEPDIVQIEDDRGNLQEGDAVLLIIDDECIMPAFCAIFRAKAASKY